MPPHAYRVAVPRAGGKLVPHSVSGSPRNERIMTPNQAKNTIKAELLALSIPYTRLSARTINFSDLARATCIFVTIHGWEAGYQSGAWYKHLRELAVQNGFRIEVQGKGIVS